MPQEITIDTPEQLTLKFKLAGSTRRILASFFDTIISYTIIISGIVFYVGSSKSPAMVHFQTILAILFFYLIPFSVIFGYYIFFESIWSGQTPGKKLFKIRVIQENGKGSSFNTILIRNLLRTVDIGFCFIGFVFIIFTPKQKRIGDLAANSIVIYEETGSLELPKAEKMPQVYINNVNLLTNIEYNILSDYLKRKKNIAKSSQEEIEVKLRNLIEAVIGQSSEIVLNNSDYLEQVYLAYNQQNI